MHRNQSNDQSDGEFDELRMYFDSEVNKLLSKIKNSKLGDNNQIPCEVDIGMKKKLMNCKNIMNKNSQKNISYENKNSQKYIDSYKNNIIKESFKDTLGSTKLTQKKTNSNKQNLSKTVEY